MADAIRQRHGLLVNFLRLLGADETRAHKDTDGLEHYIDTQTLGLLSKLAEYARQKSTMVEPVPETLRKRLTTKR